MACFSHLLDQLEDFCRLSDCVAGGDAGDGGRAALADGQAGGASAKRVVIQTHDFPDHDAMASAFALAQLLERFGYSPKLLYRGIIRSYSLWAMVTQLEIPITQLTDAVGIEWQHAPCIVVDGNPMNTNALQVTDNLFGVIDHHGNSGKPDCPFVDIRTDYGSCSSIIEGYWHELNLSPDKVVATALLMGIQMDTDFLSRRVHQAALAARKDLNSLQLAIANARIQDGIFFTVISEEITQEVISILADFFLRLREISITILVENKGETRPVSVRSQQPEVSAALVIQTALKGIGEGGGHDYMAGGLLFPSAEISDDDLFLRFFNAIKESQ